VADDDGDDLQSHDDVDDAIASAKAARCGWRNQALSHSVFETRFSTPFEPTIAVFTAPARIKVPTHNDEGMKNQTGD